MPAPHHPTTSIDTLSAVYAFHRDVQVGDSGGMLAALATAPAPEDRSGPRYARWWSTARDLLATHGSEDYWPSYDRYLDSYRRYLTSVQR